MSVPKNKRKISNTQFLATSKSILDKTFTITEKLPKRYSTRISTPMFLIALSQLILFTIGNDVYITNSATRYLRQFLFTAGVSMLKILDIMLNFVLLRPVKAKPSICNLIDLIIEEKKMISAIKQNDTNRYNKLKQEASNTGPVCNSCPFCFLSVNSSTNFYNVNSNGNANNNNNASNSNGVCP